LSHFYNRLNITPGVQLNYYSDFGFNSLPGIDFGYAVSPTITAFGNIGYTYRIPSFTDMYYKDPVNEGNPDLLPEYAWNYEIGFKTKKVAALSAEASLFYRDGKNMIDWVRAADTDPWKPINVLSLKTSGFDTNVSFKLNQLLPLIKQLAINFTYINTVTDDAENVQSRYALENLQHQIRVTLNLGYGKRITHSVSTAYYDRVNLDDYTVIDSRITYKGKKLNLFMDVTNIFDVTYQETNLVVMPGRWAKAGVSYTVF